MQTQSASFFTGLRDDLTSLALDVVRSRHVDRVTLDDEKPLVDRAEFEAMYGPGSFRRQYDVNTGPGGSGSVLMLGVVAVGAFLLLKGG